MKKYLMSGVAALALCAAFTSCSKNENLYDENRRADDVISSYNDAFIKTFGQPAANQDWGFGSIASTREENANANEWADPTKSYGGLKVPPPLTDAQIAVVKKYFQTHPNLGYEDPQWSNYFIQQVYKGYTDVPQGCATPEAYMAANGSTLIIASDHMDHLIAIDNEKGIEDHINNFNHGDCSTNNDVLTWSPDYVSSANDGPFHSDKIMYMKNSTTKSFGYANSNGSVIRTNYTGLVSFQTIIDDMGAEANCLADGWNRSFMGFDFEQMIDKECYANESEVWENGKLVSATPKELVIWGNYYINGVEQSNYVYQYNGQPVKMLSDQTNRYCGTKRTVSDGDLYSELRDANNNNAYLGKQLNTSVIDGLLADGYLPVDNKDLREWIKVGGCADGYFSDWIVTLTEAKTTSDYDIRIIAEDLNAKALEGDLENSDWDFNDVVFDVKFLGNGRAKIHVLAAGGILPLTVANREVHGLFSATADSKGNYPMINTAPGKHYELSSEPFEISGIDESKKGKDILIKVTKTMDDGTTHEFTLDAIVGEPAAKIGVSTEFEWCDERQDIRGRYKRFIEWVRTVEPVNWWNYTE